MSIDSMEHEIYQLVNSESHVDFNTINEVGSLEQWSTGRSNLALQMFNE